MTAPLLLDVALAYVRAGLSIIPIARDGSKAPDGRLLPKRHGKASWEPFKECLPTEDEVRRWFGRANPPGLATIGGAVSGGLECVDFDRRAEEIFPFWRELVEAEAPGLFARLSIARTPKPGYHVRYRCVELPIPGNMKLAEDPSVRGKERTLIETRGEGGYALAPGCPAECHETGRLYEHQSGPLLSQLETITAAERDILIASARSFDLRPVDEQKIHSGNYKGAVARPGDDYNSGGPDWAEIIEPHGWTLATTNGKERRWRRPGKTNGWSATTGVCFSKEHGWELLNVFSSNAAPFEPGTLSKFGAYALLNHGGRFGDATKALAGMGYGARRHEANGKVDPKATGGHGGENPELRLRLLDFARQCRRDGDRLTVAQGMTRAHNRDIGCPPLSDGEADEIAAAAYREPGRGVQTGGAPLWEIPPALGNCHPVPPFPVHLLPQWAAEWVGAIAEATQTPPDLAAVLVLAVSGAALAKKFRVLIRDDWSEPLNLFAVAALLVGERKSAVFAEAIAPVRDYEAEEQARAAPEIAERASEHRTLEARLKHLEGKASKVDDAGERAALQAEAAKVARELSAHEVPDAPQMFCDDITPEKLANLLARQGGRMLQASAEGTAFEIAKGRYSESVNIDVYLKGHAGDPLRVGRVSRDSDTVEQPALSVALAVQPDVIQGLADQATMKARGFLARFLYALPASVVGSRTIRPTPVPPAARGRYRRNMVALWRQKGVVDEGGKPSHHWLRLAPAADGHVEALERWLEPQLGEGEALANLGGWANKLAGMVGRLAGILHMMHEIDRGALESTVSEATISAAVQIGRDYALQHAIAAFGLMGADPLLQDAEAVWASIARRCRESAVSAHSADGGCRLTRRDIHNLNRRRFPHAKQLDPVLDLLVKESYLRPVGGSGAPGRGHASPAYLVNPLVAPTGDDTPRPHCAHSTHSTEGDGPGDAYEGGAL